MRPLSHLLNILTVAPLVALLVLVNAAVVGRYALGTPIRWAEEVSGLLMIWLVMLGAIVAERDRAHLRIPVLVDLLPERLSRGVDVVLLLVSICVTGAFAWLGWILAQSVTYKVTDLLRINYWWIDIALTVGFGCMGLLMAHQVWRQLLGPSKETR